MNLRADANMWKSQHQRAKEREDQQKKEIQNLKAKLRLREQQLFGKKSEKKKFKKESSNKKVKKRNRGQQKKNQGPKRRNFSHLEKRIEIIDLSESNKCCKHCGSPFTDTGMSSNSQILEIEIKAHIRHIKRKQYRTTCSCKAKQDCKQSPCQKIT